MTPVALPLMSPAQESGWEILLDLAEAFQADWCLVGGQMVWLLAAEHGTAPPRATDDIDLVVDVRARPAGVRHICAWLEQRGLALAGISAEGVGHRYQQACDRGPGQVIFDVLAPDGIGERADLTTTPPARTLAAPGATTALNNAERVEVQLGRKTGYVLRPALIASIIAKACATTIAARSNPDRDWSDAAFLLSLVADPIGSARNLSRSDRRRLRRLTPLLAEDHPAWRPLDRERSRLGVTTLEFILDS